jgi:alpha-glucosidase
VRRFASVFRDLAPYRRALVAEYNATGVPLLRHGVLVDPAGPWFNATRPRGRGCAAGFEVGLEQFFLGDDLLVAPVFEEKTAARAVYFPPGRWRDLWSTLEREGPAYAVVPGPLGRPPAFFRASSPWAPLFSAFAARYGSAEEAFVI